MFGSLNSGLRSRALLYTQLAQSLDAGLSLPAALTLLDRASSGPRGGTSGAEAAAAVGRGLPLIDALDRSFALPLHHRLALAAAERGGRLPACLRTLASDLDAERAQRNAAWQAIAYPLFLLHVVVPLSSTAILFTKPGLFATRSLLAIVAIWGTLGLALWFHARGVRSTAYVRTLAALPLIGSAVRSRAFTRFFRTLAELYGSGVHFQEALDASVRVVGPVAPVDDFRLAATAARGGAPMAGSFAAMRSLDPPLRSLLENAATTGGLEAALRRTTADLEERWRTQSMRLVRVSSWTLYALALFVVAASILSFYSGLYSGFDEYERHIPGHH